MSMQSELDAFKSAWRERVGPAIAQLVEDDNAALRSLAAKAARAGDRFPALVLANQHGRRTDLGALMRSGPVVVTFYRGGWCPYCSLELRAYQRVLPEITARGARLVAISPETQDNALSTAEKNALGFDVLSDTNGALADALGIRFQLSPAIKALYHKFGHDLPTHNGDGQWSLPMPASYVVTRGGRIALAHVDPDYRRRLDPAIAIEALAKLAATQAA